jgi:hypothetical protein
MTKTLLHTSAKRIIGLSIAFILIASLGWDGTTRSIQAEPPVNHGSDHRPYLNLGQTTRGNSAIQALGTHLPEVAQAYGMTAEQLTQRLQTDHHLRVDRNGRLFIEDQFEMAFGTSSVNDNPPVAAAAIPLEETFKLHSKPGANRVVYLDFDGHILSGTAWNQNYNSGQDINCPPFSFEGDASFSTNELTRVQQIWQRVAEDFVPFDVDVTTEDPGSAALTRSSSSDNQFGVRVLISPISSYVGSYGGIAYIGVFDYTGDYYKPALVFPEKLAQSEKYIAEACSHEAGHTLGLQHDGTTSGSSYYSGHGSGETGWAPIMGVGYYKNLTQWSKGEYSGANNTEDDFAVIQSNGLSFRADDHGDANASASYLSPDIQIVAAGIIERNTDVDVLAITAGAGNFAVTISPAELGANLDISATLYNEAGNLVATSNPTNLLAASFNLNVTAGTYYVHIAGTGNGDPAAGYSNYGSLGAYSLSGTVASPASNVPPVAYASASTTTGTAPAAIDFDGSASFDLDGSIVGYNWNFGDGTAGSGATVSHSYTMAGTYTATLTVTDNQGATASAAVPITIQSTVEQHIVRIASITLTVISVKGGGSQVQAAVMVTDENDNPVPGAVVTGAWSGRVKGTRTGTTDDTGTTILTSSKTSRTGRATITITDILAAGYTYDPSQNLVTDATASKRIRNY